MATGADADNWSIGRLEGDIAALKEGQREIKDSLGRGQPPAGLWTEGGQG